MNLVPDEWAECLSFVNKKLALSKLYLCLFSGIRTCSHVRLKIIYTFRLHSTFRQTDNNLSVANVLSVNQQVVLSESYIERKTSIYMYIWLFALNVIVIKVCKLYSLTI